MKEGSGYLQPDGATKEIKSSAQLVLDLGRTCLEFANTNRILYDLSGERRENDAEHSFMLAMIAGQLAEKYYPKLEQGLIAQFSLVHDLPEVITGDTPTFGLSEADKASKDAAELQASAQLQTELGPPWGDLLKRYEQQEEAEARFVRLVDKILPAVVSYHSEGKRIFKEEYGVGAEELETERRRHLAELAKEYPEFPVILSILDTVVRIRNRTIAE